VESLEPLAREKSVTIQREPSEASVHAVAVDVERMLRNLLDNAIRHCPAGGLVSLQVERGQTVCLSVRDQGDGVPPEARANIFEPFHRSAARRSEARGVGLGLATARALARKYGGDVTVVGKGNHFVLSLPRTEREPAGPSSPAQARAVLAE